MQSGPAYTLRIAVLSTRSGGDHLRRIMSGSGRGSTRLVCVDSLRDLHEKVASKQIDCFVLEHDGEVRLDDLETLEAPLLGVPVIVVGPPDDRAALTYMREGCADYLTVDETTDERCLRMELLNVAARYQRHMISCLLRHRHLGDVLCHLQEDLVKAARTDSVVGVSSRAAFDDYLPLIHADHGARHAHYGMSMIDVDRFKCFNDSYGHAEGDQALRRVAQSIQGGLRGSDLLARFGGEEFVVILPGSSEDGMLRAMERMRRRVEEEAIVHTGNEDHGIVTVSIGGALFDPDRPVEAGEIVRKADKAMYEAKAHGRNCVKLMPSLAPIRRSRSA